MLFKFIHSIFYHLIWFYYYFEKSWQWQKNFVHDALWLRVMFFAKTLWFLPNMFKTFWFLQKMVNTVFMKGRIRLFFHLMSFNGLNYNDYTSPKKNSADLLAVNFREQSEDWSSPLFFTRHDMSQVKLVISYNNRRTCHIRERMNAKKKSRRNDTKNCL